MTTPKSQNPEGKVVSDSKRELTRYDLIYTQWGAGIGRKSNGTYVKLDDHATALADMQRRLDRMESRVRAAMTANEGGLEGSWIRWRYDTFKEIADELAYESALLRGDGKGEGEL